MPSPQALILPLAGNVPTIGPDKAQLTAQGYTVGAGTSQGTIFGPSSIGYPITRTVAQELLVVIHNPVNVAVELQIGSLDLLADGTTSVIHYHDVFRCPATSDASHRMHGFPGGNGMRVRMVTLEGPSGSSGSVYWKVYAV